MDNTDNKATENKSVFMADLVIINGPRADGNFRVSFDVGIRQFENIKNLPLLNGKELVVAVVQGQEFRRKQQEPPAKEKEDVGGILELDDKIDDEE